MQMRNSRSIPARANIFKLYVHTIHTQFIFKLKGYKGYEGVQEKRTLGGVILASWFFWQFSFS